jgi:N-methylhydantoinase B/oxoprolinase/acetone carboxylase alpha subunit
MLDIALDGAQSSVSCVLVNEDIPLKQGCLTPIKVIPPRGTIFSPAQTAATVGGNVDTSGESGGKGKYPEGDGCLREIEFRRDLDVAVLAERRSIPLRAYVEGCLVLEVEYLHST